MLLDHCRVKNELTRPASNAYPECMEFSCRSRLGPILETDDLDWDLGDLRAAVVEAQRDIDEGRVARADEAFAVFANAK